MNRKILICTPNNCEYGGVQNYIYNTLYQILVLIAQLLTTPYVSRVLGVTNIGIYQYSQSIASYFVLVGAVGTATLYPLSTVLDSNSVVPS